MTIVASIVKYSALVLPLVLICWEYRLKYIDRDGRTTEHKRTRTIVLILGIGICILGIASTIFDDYNKAKRERSLADSNANLNRQLNEIREAQTNLPAEVFRGVNQGVTKLLSQATNPALGDAALSATIQDLAATIRDKKKTAAEFEAISTDGLDIPAWKKRYESKLEIAKLVRDKGQQEAEQARRESERAAQKAARETAENAARAAQEAKERENIISEKTRPVFDYAIRNLLMFVDRARRRGESPVTTYKGLPPVIDSQVKEAGQISARDNPSWLFGIFVTQSPRTLVIRCVDVNPHKTNALNFARIFMKRDLMSAATVPQKYASTLPSVLERFNYVITLTISFQDQNLETVATSMVVLSKSSEPFPAVEDKQPYADYTKCVDVALGNLIGAHEVVVDHFSK
jgi:hypothetical protein